MRKKIYALLLTLCIMVAPLAGCATGIGYWNQLSPATQTALIQAAQQTAKEVLVSAQAAYKDYLAKCAADKVQTDATEVAKLQMAITAAQHEVDRLTEADK